MNICKRLLLPVFIITFISVIVIACNTEKKKADPPAKIDYLNFKDSVMKAVEPDSTHTKNFFAVYRSIFFHYYLNVRSNTFCIINCQIF